MRWRPASFVVRSYGRPGVLAVAFAFAACAATAPPPAPPPTATPAEDCNNGRVSQPLIPMAFAFDRVAVGSWAEYAWSIPNHTHIQRHALVARGPEGITIELLSQFASHARFVQAFTFAPGAEFRGETRKIVDQDGDDQPMQMPLATVRLYARVDPSKFVGTETVTVRAGTLTARHYRDRTVCDERVDFWIDDAVMPFGLVKLESEQKRNWLVGDYYNAELVGNGNDAVPLITKAPRPYDLEYLRKKGEADAASRAAKKRGASP